MIYRIEKDKNIELAADLIINGNIIIYSTDTLYGFGVDATNSQAIKKTWQLLMLSLLQILRKKN